MRLGELERAVMEVLWRHPAGIRARDVAEALPTHPATTTVLTVLDRLTHKGLVSRTKQGRAHLYTAAASKAAFLATAMRTAMDEADDRGAVLGHFVGTVTEDEVLALRQALDQIDRAGTGEDDVGEH
ncbi:BlaI/MecI/CopY family transcriptional regulator [Amycolatopsis palatopharyngis]|uniref:BlaI/MecI/CopY family transcriptional regulator n=1 Tax=Amycolatopsis palatopharyngis TaxID=187982 RepID=UPI000E24A260|nr:BlaI/MecI/CopY family transcriptional regulator [Amycolatopsis palatopharyngis]